MVTISSSSCKLSEIGRSLKENISLKALEKGYMKIKKMLDNKNFYQKGIDQKINK